MKPYSHLLLKVLTPTFCVFFFAQAVKAQSLIATTDAKEVLVRNTFEVIYEFSGHANNSFRPPAFKGLEIVSGPSRGSETKIYNGQVSQKTTFSYILAGLNPGTFTIRPASISFKGKKIFSNSLVVKVLSKSPAGKGDVEDVFLETVVLDTPAYPGSQINVTYVLHTSINLADMSLRGEDEYNSFIKRDLEVDPNGVYEVLQGKQYLRKVIKQVALYPTEAGLVKVEPMTIDIEVPEKVKSRNTSLGRRFFSTTRYRTKVLKSDPVEIQTKNFPRPIPKNFSGATGRLEMEAVLGDTEISTDDAVSLKVQLTGVSNPTEIVAPFLEVGDELTVFPAKVILDTIKQQDGLLAFQKTFEFLIQPQKVGKYHLLVKASYFDTVSESFKELKSPVLSLNVKQGNTSTVEDDMDSGSQGVSSYMPIVWGLLGVLGLLLGLYFWKRNQREIMLDEEKDTPVQEISEKTMVQSARPMEVKKEVFKPFVITKHIAGKEYLQEVLNETILYFGNKLQLPHAQFRKDQVFNALKEKGNNPEKIQELMDWWSKIEASIYANMPMHDDESIVLDEIKAIVEKLKY